MAGITRPLIASSTVQASGMAILFVEHLLLARLLGVSEYGAYVYLLSWVNVAVVFGKFGMDRALVRYVSEAVAVGNWSRARGALRTAFVAIAPVVFATASVAIGAFVLVEGTSSPGLYPAALWAPGVFAAMVVCFAQKGALLGVRRVGMSKLPTEVVRPVLIGLLVVMAAIWKGEPTATTAMQANLAATGMAAALSAFLWRRDWPETTTSAQAPPTEELSLRRVRPFVMISVAQTIMQQADRLMIGALMGPAHVAIYAIGNRLSGLVATGLRAASPALQPNVSRLHAQGRHEELRRIVAIVTIGVGAVTVLACTVLLVAGHQILGWFGPGYVAAVPVLRILLLGQVVNAFSGFTGVLLSMTGRQLLASRGLWVGAATNVALNLALIPRYGLLGAAAATLVSMAVWNTLLVRWVKRELGFSPTLGASLARTLWRT